MEIGRFCTVDDIVIEELEAMRKDTSPRIRSLSYQFHGDRFFVEYIFVRTVDLVRFLNDAVDAHLQNAVKTTFSMPLTVR